MVASARRRWLIGLALTLTGCVNMMPTTVATTVHHDGSAYAGKPYPAILPAKADRGVDYDRYAFQVSKDDEPILALPWGVWQSSGINPYATATSHLALRGGSSNFAWIQQQLQAGNWPKAGDVRPETLINGLDRPERPTGGEAVRLRLEGAPAKFADGRYLLRVGLATAERAASPRHWVFVIDVSESMKTVNRLGLIKHGLRTMVPTLGADDSMAIVVFGDRAGLRLPPTSGRERERILDAIDRFELGSDDDEACGLAGAYEAAEAASARGGHSQVVLCTDREADPGQWASEVRSWRRGSVSLATLGFHASRWRQRWLEDLAEVGSGRHAGLGGDANAMRLWAETLNEETGVALEDAKLQVQFNPAAVRNYRLIGYANDQRYGTGGPLGESAVATGFGLVAYYDVTIDRAYPTDDLATAALQYRRPGQSQRQEERVCLQVRDLAPSFGSASSRFRFGSAIAASAEKLAGSTWARDWRWSEILKVAEAAASGPEHQEGLTLIRRAAGLGQGDDDCGCDSGRH